MAAPYNASYQMSGDGEFSKLAQTIGTNIQKISQNGTNMFKQLTEIDLT